MIVDAPTRSATKSRSPQPLAGRLRNVARQYQQTLAQNPHHPEALAGMSLVALASRQSDSAVRMAQAAVAEAPKMTSAWVVLGQALRAARRFEEAETAYQTALRLDPVNPLARLGRGELKIAIGQPEEAIHDFELALQRDPAHVSAHMGLGHALACLGRFQQALAHYEDALTLRPRTPEAEFAAGFALARLGKPKDAEKRYRRALALRPDFAAAWMNLGCLLSEQGRSMYAESALKRAIQLRPDLVAGWVNLALLERTCGHMEEAETHLRRAFALNPDQVETQVAWAQFCAARHDPAGAWGWVRWALARDPENDEAVNTMGILLHTAGRYGEAIAAFERAESLGSRAAVSNCGNSMLDLGRMDEALRMHKRAVELDPHNPGAHYNLALTELRLGEWARGWQEYESRWSFREVHRRPRKFKQPRWTGEPLAGQRVLLHAEQGLGDTIQFCRYAALVVARGGHPILQVQEAAERLLHSLEVVRAGQAEVAVLGADPPKFDLECPLMSLPALFGTTIDTVPWTGPYLGANPGTDYPRPDMDASRAELPAPEDCGTLRVGIAWAGNPRYKADRQRSVRLLTILPLLRTSGIQWISLQKGEAAEQLADLPKDVHVADGSSRDRDLADTAALVATLDLVITTDTCIAHLAGAMGKPVWILLPYLSDWRWMQNTEVTPWYPTARLFRQPAPGDWASLLTRAARMLPSIDSTK